MLQRSEEWHAVRAGKLTASRVAAALGLDPYMSRQKLWRQLTGEEEQGPPTQRMQDGIHAEPYAIAQYEIESGYLIEPVGFVPHPSIPWLGASPDGLINADGLVEVKCPDPTYWKKHEAVPTHYFAQIQAQLECTDRSWCDYWQWNQISGACVLFRVERDRTWWTWALRHLEQFWEYVETKTQPPRGKPK